MSDRHQLNRIEQKLDTVLALLQIDDPAIQEALGTLKSKTDTLKAAIDAAVAAQSAPPMPYVLSQSQPVNQGVSMANPTVDAVLAQVTASDTVIDSATLLVNGFQAIIADAVTKALNGGATAAELAPVTDALAVIKGKTDALAQAVVANTPTPPPPPPPGSTQAAQRPHPHKP